MAFFFFSGPGPLMDEGSSQVVDTIINTLSSYSFHFLFPSLFVLSLSLFVFLFAELIQKGD